MSPADRRDALADLGQNKDKLFTSEHDQSLLVMIAIASLDAPDGGQASECALLWRHYQASQAATEEEHDAILGIEAPRRGGRGHGGRRTVSKLDKAARRR